jgi:hypothetical protein
MKRVILILLTLLITAPLWAAVDKGVTWIAPTERVNGDPLLANEIAGYDLECVREGTGEIVYATGIPAGATTHQTAEVFDEGNFSCRMRTLDTDGLVSDWGNSAVFTVGRCETTDCRPLPPRSISVVLP